MNLRRLKIFLSIVFTRDSNKSISMQKPWSTDFKPANKWTDYRLTYTVLCRHLFWGLESPKRWCLLVSFSYFFDELVYRWEFSNFDPNFAKFSSRNRIPLQWIAPSSWETTHPRAPPRFFSILTAQLTVSLEFQQFKVFQRTFQRKL